MAKTTKEIGRIAENLVSDFLQANNYEILLRNYKSYFGEIDIITKDPKTQTIIACEVKFRRNKNILPFCINQKQQQRIMNSLLYFWQNNPQYLHYNLRCDVLLVDKTNKITHIQNAWEEKPLY